MELKEAIEIIRDLALENALDADSCDEELLDEAERQDEAFRVFDNFVNHCL
jgi:hypothetical protein